MDLLQIKATYIIDDKIMHTPVDEGISEWSYVFNWPNQLVDDQIKFGVSIFEENSSPFLYNYTFSKYFLEQINQIPSYTENVIWAPDDSGALIIGKDHEIFFSPNDGGMLINLSLILGDKASEFFWLPPSSD